MKRTVYILLALLSVAVGCSKLDDNGSSGGGKSAFSIKAALPGGSLKSAWTAEDQVRCFITSDGKVATTTLTSTGAGATTTFSTSSASTGSEYRLLYPASQAIIGVPTALYATVPSQQVPVEGGVEDVAFLAAACISNASATAAFMPATAFIPFTLTGEGTADVTRITFTTENEEILAGDIRIISMTESSMEVSSDNTRGRVAPTGSISMSGSFKAGAKYYVSVVPGTVSGLRVKMEDKEGRVQNFTVSKSLTLTRGKVADVTSITVPAFTGRSDFAPRFQYTKKGIKPYVFVFMADGFTEAEREKYNTAAEAAIDHIFSVQPYKGLKEYFSAYVCWTPSETSGVGTRWGTVYAGSGSSAMMGSYGQEGRDKIYDYVKDLCPEVKDGTISLTNVGIFMLNNNTSYIRPVCDWESSGRFVTPVGLTPNTSNGYSQWCFGGSWQNYEFRDGVRHDMTAEELTALGYASSGRRNGDYRDECLHEGAGHGFGRLGDEYWSSGSQAAAGYTGLDYYHNSTLPSMLNIAASKTDVPWSVLNDLRSEMMAKDARYSRIGTYEGGYGYETGIWRAEQVSAMMDNRPYFSTWERALIYMRLMRSSGENVNFDPRKVDDLKKYLELDVSFKGIRDPLRDND